MHQPFALQVEDLPVAIGELRGKGARFRNDIVTGIGVRQILIQDPSGNLTELFKHALRPAGI